MAKSLSWGISISKLRWFYRFQKVCSKSQKLKIPQYSTISTKAKVVERNLFWEDPIYRKALRSSIAVNSTRPVGCTMRSLELTFCWLFFDICTAGIPYVQWRLCDVFQLLKPYSLSTCYIFLQLYRSALNYTLINYRTWHSLLGTNPRTRVFNAY
jgi:hypothetical protein